MWWSEVTDNPLTKIALTKDHTISERGIVFLESNSNYSKVFYPEVEIDVKGYIPSDDFYCLPITRPRRDDWHCSSLLPESIALDPMAEAFRRIGIITSTDPSFINAISDAEHNECDVPCLKDPKGRHRILLV